MKILHRLEAKLQKLMSELLIGQKKDHPLMVALIQKICHSAQRLTRWSVVIAAGQRKIHCLLKAVSNQRRSRSEEEFAQYRADLVAGQRRNLHLLGL